MNGGTAADTDDTLYTNWLLTGVWQGLLSGVYLGFLSAQGDYGPYWSSTAYDADFAFNLCFYDEYVYPVVGDLGKLVGYAVRCLI